MTKDEMLDMYNQVDTQVKAETGMSLVEALSHTALTLITLMKARKHAKRGNYAAAAYYALMWQGFNANRHSMIQHYKSK